MKTFEQMWAEKEAAGFNYGEDALTNVRFGWNLAMQELRKEQACAKEAVQWPVYDEAKGG